MAILDAIGTFAFISLQGLPMPPGGEVEIEQRRGVDGTAFWRTGNRGRPFSLRSFVDASSILEGWSFIQGYSALKAGPLQTLRFRGVDSLGFGWLVEVLDVRPVQVRKTILSVGGLIPGSNAVVEADWQLIAVALSQFSQTESS